MEIPLQESYLEQPCEGQFHYCDDCKGLVISEAIGTFLVCPAVEEELRGRRLTLRPFYLNGSYVSVF